MKVNIAMRLASILLMCTIATSIWTGSTLAKYSSTATGSDTATVAKWNVIIDNKSMSSMSATSTINMNIFGIAYDIDNPTNKAHMDRNQSEGGSLTGNWEKASVIAPGTCGVADLVVNNSSDVTANITVSFAESISTSSIVDGEDNTTGLDFPIQYCIGTDTVNTLSTAMSSGAWTDDVTSLSKTVTLAKNSGMTTVTIFWKWPLVEDVEETVLNTKELTLIATVNATQVD